MKEGKLFIQVLEAKNFIVKDNSGAVINKENSDPYVKVYLDNKKIFKTPALHKTLDPKWERSRTIPLTKDDHFGSLSISIWNSNLIKWDEFLGEVSFSLESLLDGVPRDDWYQLQARKDKTETVSGEIHLRLLFLGRNSQVEPKTDVFVHPLHYLLCNGLIESFQSGLDLITDVESKDSEGKTPLHIACARDLPKIVESLLQRGSNIHAQDDHGAQPIHYAAAHSPGSLDLLLKSGALVSDVDRMGRLPLHYAAIGNKVENIRKLIDKGADINERDLEGKTPLQLVVVEKDERGDITRELLANGASIDIEDVFGVSVANLCCGSHHKNHGEEINERTKLEILRGAGLKDEREFELRKKFKKAFYFEANDLSEVLSKNRQYSVWAPSGTTFSIIMHQNYNLEESHIKQMEITAFMITRSKQGVHKEPSYLQDLIGYGSYEPFEITKSEDVDVYYVIMPYAKNAGAQGYYDIIIYSDQDLVITQLKDWKHSKTIEGEWGAGRAGGRMSENNSWLKNPQYRLKLSPPEDDTSETREIGIALAQTKSVLDMVPYSLVPYEFFIGLYVLDKDMFDLVAECDKWKNSQEVYLHFTAKQGVHEFVVIPTTQQPNQFTSFKLTIFSDVPCEISPVETKQG